MKKYILAFIAAVGVLVGTLIVWAVDIGSPNLRGTSQLSGGFDLGGNVLTNGGVATDSNQVPNFGQVKLIPGLLCGYLHIVLTNDFTFTAADIFTNIPFNFVVKSGGSCFSYTGGSRIIINKDVIVDPIPQLQFLRPGGGGGTETGVVAIATNGIFIPSSAAEEALSKSMTDVLVVTVPFRLFAGDYFEVFSKVTDTSIILDYTANTNSDIPAIIMNVKFFNGFD